MPPKQDPYEILGLPRGAAAAEVRARYRELARTHHPDKLHHLAEDERRRREDHFKEITVAYHYLAERRRGAGGGGGGDDEEDDDGSERWRAVWSRVESMFQDPDVWKKMGSILKDTMVDVVKAQQHQQQHQHTLQVPVTLEEVHRHKTKKIRVFLRGAPEPVFLHVQCGLFPRQEVACVVAGAERTVRLEMVAQEHARFRHDDVLGTQDLYHTMRVTLCDVLQGFERTVAGLDGEDIAIAWPGGGARGPEAPLHVPGKGLWGKGDLYVSLEVAWPTVAEWERLPLGRRGDLLELLRELQPC